MMEVSEQRDVETGDQISSTNENPPVPPTRKSRKKGGWRAVKYIIAMETFEKMATVSLGANIAVYLRKKYNMDGIMLINVVNIWNASTNIFTLPGAILSDAYLGRFCTVLIGSLAAMLGMLLMTLGAAIPKLRPPSCNDLDTECIQAKAWQLAILFAALLLLALGSGGIRPCNIAFGTDQFDTTTEKGRLQLSRFYNWWYFSFTVSLVIALTGLVYIQTNISWTIGFAIPSGCFVLALIIYVLGCKTYVYVQPKGSIFIDIFRVVVAAFRKRRVELASSNDFVLYDPRIDESSGKVTRLHRSDQLKLFDKAAVIVDSSEVNDEGVVVNNWRLCSVQQVEQLKSLIGVLPVALTCVLCIVVLEQQNIFAVLQAMQMDRKVGKSFVIPPGWTGLTSMVTLSVWILVYENIVLTIWRMISKKNDVRLSMKTRIKIGIIISICAMATSATTEFKRREAALKAKTYESPLSVLFLMPQLALSGLTEAFAAVAMMEFLTTRMPEQMRCLGSAIYFLCTSMSSYISTAIANVLHTATKRADGTAWLGGRDLNKNRLDCYYAIIACIAIFNFFYFTFIGSKFVQVDRKSNVEELELSNTNT
ncbi:hypothetical protein RND81_02G032900 [Saponaria officinalis]|uniref:Uncharacterized protein n=1 Tax=Saponaria officinalis TaxID=3572 RepID=A0AAW1MJM5_SAPOF